MGFLKFGAGHTKAWPKYELILPETAEAATEDERIWIPNSIVMGTANREMSPIRRLRSAGDLWALRLFVDLYFHHNLRDEGGVSPAFLREQYERRRVAEHGPYIIWAFRPDKCSLSLKGPLTPHKSRPEKGKQAHPAFESLELLEQMGLIAFVPHLLENDSMDAEVVHAFGRGGKSELPIETAIGEAAYAAAVEMGAWKIEDAEREGYEYFCPVLRTLPNVRMAGIARLTYRPHTSRTSAWYARVQESGETWIECYRELQLKSANALSELAS
jgi:hypothetical protein